MIQCAAVCVVPCCLSICLSDYVKCGDVGATLAWCYSGVPAPESVLSDLCVCMCSRGW